MTTTFKKQRIALNNFLQGRKFYDALRAMNLSEKYHFRRNEAGDVLQFRKDGSTPEFHHQVRIALNLSDYADLIDQEGAIITALLHDTPEDYGVSIEELVNKFGAERSHSIWLTTKKFRGEFKDKTSFFLALSEDHRASATKGIDRYENFNSMVGVFGLQKQLSYLDEGENDFLPMLERADSNFPEQHGLYMNIRHHLKDQIALIRSHNRVETERNHLQSMLTVRDDEIARLMQEIETLKMLADPLKRSPADAGQ